MFTMVFSVLWVIASTLGLGVKALFMCLTKRDIDMAQDKVAQARLHLQTVDAARRHFILGSMFGFLILMVVYLLGLIKIWVVIVDCVFFVIALVMNIVFIGYLKKKSSTKDVNFKA